MRQQSCQPTASLWTVSRIQWPQTISVRNGACRLCCVHHDITAYGLKHGAALGVSGPFLFTHRLIEPLKAAGSARVVYVYSLAELSAKLDFNNLTGDGCRSDLAMYASSKVAILLQVQEMQRRLAGTQSGQCSIQQHVALSVQPVMMWFSGLAGSGIQFFAAQPGLTRSTLVLQLDWTKAAAALLVSLRLLCKCFHVSCAGLQISDGMHAMRVGVRRCCHRAVRLDWCQAHCGSSSITRHGRERRQHAILCWCV